MSSLTGIDDGYEGAYVAMDPSLSVGTGTEYRGGIVISTGLESLVRRLASVSSHHAIGLTADIGMIP
jgi:hypothetical protein